MAQGRFLHIAFNFDGPPLVKELEPTFNLAVDWVRYAPNCWIVYTTSTPMQWHQRLKPKVKPKDQFLIVEINSRERYGWLQPWIWEWLSKQR